MRIYFAPMEGLTDSFYRRLHHAYFGGVDRYYMPFFSPTMHRTLTHKEDRELPMADSEDFAAVPQVLTRVPGDFLWAAQVCRDRGYEEINLNVGCPSGTVVSKGKGAGMLVDTAALDSFLEEIFAASVLPVSVKTRLGMVDSQEFPAVLEVFNRYPIRELTIHPRVRKQFYDGDVDMEMFRYAVQNSKNPICCNGNLNTREDIEAIGREFPQVEAVMIGRGLIGSPDMLCPSEIHTLRSFHDALLETYLTAFGGSRNAMFRMKEHWSYLIEHFEDSKKLGKRLRKTTDLNEYRGIVDEIFQTLPRK